MTLPTAGTGGFAASDGWLAMAERHPSPNCDARPAGVEVDLLVVHGISLPPGRFGGPEVIELFQNRLDPAAHPYFAALDGLRVSSHLLIRRDGSLLQFVPLERRAWHAGVSRFRGRERCNDFSVGVELEGTDDMAYETVQYQRLAQVTALLMARYPAISEARITGHADVAPGRKTDPGAAFDWPRFRCLLRAQRGRG